MKTEYYDLKNKRALISGGDSGIGSSIFEHLCEQGVEVYFFDIDKKEAKKTINKIKKKKLNFIAKAEIFLTQLETPYEVTSYALKKAKEKGLATILNPAPACKIKEMILN